MDAEEKKEAIRMLKLGRNPWREQYKSNWQLQRIAEEFHRTANIYELIRTYAPDTGNVNDALRNIIRKQKEIAEEKKLDLVLVSPNAQVPVCKIMNYGKYKFEQAKKEKEAKKKQKIWI